jgi:electron-transferring-flavoprotein dehydrogenase
MIETDVLIVGAGPAGLAAAIALKRGAKKYGNGQSPRVIVLEKGRSVGSHVLSGAIIDPSGFEGLLTAEEIGRLPVEAKVAKESFRTLLCRKWSLKVPWVPPMMSSRHYPVASLTKVVQYLAAIAQKEGVEIYTGYSVTELIEKDGVVVGVRTGEKGLGKNGEKKSNHLPSEEVRSKTVILAEGGCGILTEKLISAKNLQGVRPQTYAIGIKELIEVPAGTQKAGEVMHTFGWPSDFDTYGGGFVYHVSETQVMVGYAYALDYKRPEIDPFDLFRQFKSADAVKCHFKDGKTVAYGAKVIPEGGYYSVPKMKYPGVLIIGDGAGLLDSLRIKGVHIALQSGMAAAESILTGNDYETILKKTPGWKEMKRVRNVRAGFCYGLPWGVLMAGLAWVTRGLFPIFRIPGLAEGDAEGLGEIGNKACGISPVPSDMSSSVMPDRLTDVFMSGTIHEENQPCHLKVLDRAKCEECQKKFGSPCTRFCPAEVYRLEDGELEIDFSNCLHCKTCRIKCPMKNIDWTFPQGGDGPRYTRM